MKTNRRPSLLWPVLLLGLGAVVLLQTTGLLPAGWWAALAQLWPVLFIVIGLDMLLGRRSRGAVASVAVVSALLVAGALVWAAVRASQAPPGSTQYLIQNAPGLQTLNVYIEFKTGELQVSSLAQSDNLMEAQVQNSRAETAVQNFSTRGTAGDLTLRQTTNALLWPFLPPAEGSPPAHWNVRLTGALPLAVSVRAGAGSTTLDLTGLKLTELTLTTGVGQTDVTFPSEIAARARLNLGAGQATLIIPADLPARLSVTAGLTPVSVAARFGQAGNVYTTPGFDTGGAYVDVTLNAGLGHVEVR